MTNINCTFYCRERCAHPSVQPRGLFGLFVVSAPCVMLDARVSKCRYQIQHQKPDPPPSPPGAE